MSHQNARGETPFDQLSRSMRTLNIENRFLLDSLPTIEAVTDYTDLLDTYGVGSMTQLGAQIEEGDSPGAYNAFLDKHGLTWRRHFAVSPTEEVS